MTSRRRWHRDRGRVRHATGLRRLLACVGGLCLVLGSGLVLSYMCHANARIRTIGVWYILGGLTALAFRHGSGVLEEARRRKYR